MTLIITFFFFLLLFPVSCGWKLTWFVLLAKSQRAVLSEPFTCFSLLQKCKQQAPVSARVWQHLPAVFLKSLFFFKFVHTKERERGRSCWFCFFLLCLQLWVPIFLGEVSGEAAVAATVRSCRVWRCAAVPKALWLGCVLSPGPAPASSHPVSLPDQCWATGVTSRLVPLLCSLVLSCPFPPEVAVPLPSLQLCMLVIFLEGGWSLIKGAGLCCRSKNLPDIRALAACAQLELHLVAWVCEDAAGSLSSGVPRCVTAQEPSCCRAGSGGACFVWFGVHSRSACV